MVLVHQEGTPPSPFPHPSRVPPFRFHTAHSSQVQLDFLQLLRTSAFLSRVATARHQTRKTPPKDLYRPQAGGGGAQHDAENPQPARRAGHHDEEPAHCPPAGNLEALPGWTLLAVGLLLQAKQAADPVHRVRNRGQEAQPEQPVRDVGHSPPAARDDQGRAHRHEQQGQVQPEPPQRAGQGRQQGLQRTQVDVGAPRPAERPPRTRAVRRAGRSCSTATAPPRPPSS